MPKKKKTASKRTVAQRIRETVVVPKNTDAPQLISPLPQKEVRNFGAMPFEAQANLIFNALPANESEIVGTTENSGAGAFTAPKIAAS